MPGDVLFKEDFFERVVDVNWESQPKVYWMAGTGFPLIVNNLIFFQTGVKVFSSDDGIHWDKSQEVGIHSGLGQWGIGLMFTGGWMRSGLKEGGMPVWFMGGTNAKSKPDAGTCASTDGLSMTTHQYMDESHSFDSLVFPGGTEVTMVAFDFPSGHRDLFMSSNGMNWHPAKYHGASGNFLIAPQAAPLIRPLTRAIIVNEDISIDRMHELLAVNTRNPVAIPAPLDGQGAGGGTEIGKKIVFNGNRVSASGRVKKGEFSGKNVTCEIANPTGEGGFHGDSKIKVTLPVKDEETGQPKKIIVDCGIARTECVNYGHYVFCVGGASKPAALDEGKNQLSAISYSEDGVTWKKQDLGYHGQVNVLAVGPRE